MSKNNNAPVWLAQPIVCSGSNGISHSKALRKSKNLTLSPANPVMRHADKGHFLHTAGAVVHRTLHAMRNRIEDRTAAGEDWQGQPNPMPCVGFTAVPGMTLQWPHPRYFSK
ncbi:hypothetical protein GGR79_001033 [Xanthomonas arboricola]|uniref:hypothetical protein n=1 Tax=Xanthomonas arboricola TaxID=56448 RepID=UPI001430DF37|nr:hypothetical protein [Xanthomonas arboricola]NJC29566.1 hypothetical protein [Xanthomonas arboricola]